jgi:hypothetical protein
MPIKWSQLANAALPISGSEIFCLGIEGVDSYQIAFEDLVNQIVNAYCSSGYSLQAGINLTDTAGCSFYTAGGGDISVNSSNGSGLFLYSDGSASFLNINGLGIQISNDYITSCNGSFQFNAQLLDQTGNAGIAGAVLKSTGNATKWTGNAGFTGTLAAAVSGGKTILNGIIQP